MYINHNAKLNQKLHQSYIHAIWLVRNKNRKAEFNSSPYFSRYPKQITRQHFNMLAGEKKQIKFIGGHHNWNCVIMMMQ